MPYFLDGNNLIGTARGTSRPSDADRQALLRELADRLRRTRAKVVVFFDGPRTGTGPTIGALSVRESGRVSADEAILAEISRRRAPGEVVVVTADRGLAARAREAGAKIAAPKDFWSRFGAESGRARGGADPTIDVDEWTAYFADEGNRDR